MKLVNVYDSKESLSLLFSLLEERPKYANISHKRMPTWEQHKKFFYSEPYKVWYLIEVNYVHVGAIYLDKFNEIGIAISYKNQRNGYAKQAIKKLMKKHPCEQFLANIAPDNVVSKKLFEKLGFELCQCTYRSPSS